MKEDIQIDARNVSDEFKNQSHEDIVKALDARGVTLEIAIENTLRDYNMGTIVRTANAYGVRRIHVIGRRQWNKRGAMATDKYLYIDYHESAESFAETMHSRDVHIVAIDNVEGSKPLAQTKLPQNMVMIFGQEGPGISPELLATSESIVAIEQLGSTRSMNVGVAAGVAMYEWVRRNVLE